MTAPIRLLLTIDPRSLDRYLDERPRGDRTLTEVATDEISSHLEWIKWDATIRVSDIPHEPSVADPLIGQWFHSLHADGETVVWQGQILGRTPEGLYLVQLYEWFVGAPSDRKLVPAAQVTSWRFYSTHEAMNDWYLHVYSPRRNAAREALSGAVPATDTRTTR